MMLDQELNPWEVTAKNAQENGDNPPSQTPETPEAAPGSPGAVDGEPFGQPEPGPEPNGEPVFDSTPPQAPPPPVPPPYYPPVSEPDPAPAEPKKRVRRVGTLSLGLALIFTGAVILYSFFGERVNLITMLKFSPVILIAVGIEVIVSSFFARNTKFKYDILGFFLCGLLVMGSLAASAVAGFGEMAIKYQREYRSQVQQAQTKLDESVADNPSVASAYFVNQRDYGFWEVVLESPTHQEMEQYFYLQVTLMPNYADKTAFATDAKKVMDDIAASGVKYGSLYINSYSSEDSKGYSLTVDHRNRKKMEVQELERLAREEPYSENSGMEVY